MTWFGSIWSPYRQYPLVQLPTEFQFAIVGEPGVGKTATAIHLIQDTFPMQYGIILKLFFLFFRSNCRGPLQKTDTATPLWRFCLC
jgi:GTPase SAR1 family protein